MRKLRGATCTYVQAWEFTDATNKARQGGLCYTQEIALDRLADGFSIEIVTIIRHDDGRREIERGTLLDAVYNHREGIHA